MAILKRKDQESNIPEEIKDYYQSERRERVGVAWLLALGTLMLTLVLAFGLFFSGRWLYRKVAHKNTGQVTQVTKPGEQKPEGQKAGETKPATTQQQGPTGTTSISTSTPRPPVPHTTPSVESTSTTTPNTGPTLVNTGPTSEED